MLNASGKLDALSKCIAFVDDLHKWVSYCDNLKNYILVEEAQTECINSIYMCAQGFYKEAITTLRQFFEHNDLGRWANIRLAFIKQHRSQLYQGLLKENKLHSYLAEFDR